MKKKILLSCGCIFLFFVCSITLFGGLTLIAFNSNTNIPVFSDVVERVEKVVFSPSMVKSQIESLDIEDLKSMLANIENFKADVSGAADVSLPDQSYSMKIDLDGTYIQSKNSDIEIGINVQYDIGGLSSTVGLNAKGFINENQSFVQVTNLPEIAKSYIPFDLDKWILVDTSEYVQEEISRDTFAESYLMNLKSLVTHSNTFVENIKLEPDQIFGDIRANCFSIDLNKEEITSLFEEMGRSFLGASQMEDINFKINSCVGRRDQKIYSFSMSAYSNTLTAEFNLHNFQYSSEEIIIEKPTEYITLEELVNDYMESLYSTYEGYDLDYDYSDYLDTYDF